MNINDISILMPMYSAYSEGDVAGYIETDGTIGILNSSNIITLTVGSLPRTITESISEPGLHFVNITSQSGVFFQTLILRII